MDSKFLKIKIVVTDYFWVEYYQRTRPPDLEGSFLYEVHGDNSDPKSRQITGTYVPQELILEIASWVSIEFYDKCNKITKKAAAQI